MTDELLRPGDILAFSRRCRWHDPRTWLAWRIQKTTGWPWNHVEVVDRDAVTGEWYAIGALGLGGVVKRPLRAVVREFDGDMAVGRVDCPPVYRASVLRWANQQVGRGYNWRKILVIRLLQMILGAEVVGGLQAPGLRLDPDLLICSELIVRGWRQSGWPLPGCGPFAGPGAVMRSPGIEVWEFPIWRFMSCGPGG